jgi:serine/threonine protein kinase
MDQDPDDADGLIGELIGDRYRVESVLGEGGMGTVFRCRHVALDRDVAVKLLHPELLENEQMSARFDREAKSTSRLEHPNVLQVLDFGTWERPDSGRDAKYMVLQLLSGHELADELGEPHTPARVIEIGLAVVRGLEHAHSRGIAHRDLKPENVFVTVDHDGKELLKILDFGLALMLSGAEDEQRLTRVGMVFGTPQYMSPEQATGAESDERTDIYALGIMLWELLAGHAPFDGDNAVAILRKQVSLPLPNEELPPGTPAPLIELISAMTQKAVADRMATATEVRSVLESLRAEPSASALSLASAASSLAGASLASANSMSQAAPGAVVRELPPSGPGAPSSPRRLSVMELPLQYSEDIAERFRVPRSLVLGTAATLAFILIVMVGLALSGDSDSNSASAADAEPESVAAPWNFGAGMLANLAPDAAIAELDAAIEKQDDAAALGSLDTLLKEHPDDPRLHLRRGQILARQEGKQRPALEAFGRAIELDGSALDDDRSYAALLEVLRDPEMSGEAVEFAIAHLGTRGHDFLVELVNRDERVLPWVDRHRVLQALDDHREHAARVDQPLNRNIDLWQAWQTAHPCKNYGAALDSISANPHPSHFGSLYYTRAPKPAKPSKNSDDETSKEGDAGEKEAASACEGLEERRESLISEFAEKFPEAEKAKTLPKQFEAQAKKRKKKGRRRFRLFD